MRNHTALAILFVLSGCNGAPAPDLRRGAIVGGTTDNADPAVVFLLRQSQQGDEYCTGELISPTVVLTAAHCVSGTAGAAPGAGGDQYFVYFGTDATQVSTAQMLPVAEVHADPMWDPNQDPTTDPAHAGHDSGVAILAAPVNDVMPLPLNLAPLADTLKGQPVRLVGYGITDGQQQQGAGVKRQVTTTLNQVYPGVVYVGSAGQQGCNGDSGGPAFMMLDGAERIVATTSGGDNACNQGGYYTRVDVERPFLAQWVPGLTSPPDMSAPPAPADAGAPAPDAAAPPASPPGSSGNGNGSSGGNGASGSSGAVGGAQHGSHGGCAVGGAGGGELLPLVCILAEVVRRRRRSRRRRAAA